MLSLATSLRLAALAVFVMSALYVHWRGRARFGLLRALTDYTVLLAPFNALVLLLSRVNPRPFADASVFPELAPLQAHWRVILFCDVERPLKSRLFTRLNRWFAARVMAASATQNEAGEHVGAINRFFAQAYRLRLAAKRLKDSHRRVYYAGKWALIAGLVYLVFVA